MSTSKIVDYAAANQSAALKKAVEKSLSERIFQKIGEHKNKIANGLFGASTDKTKKVS